MGRFIQEGKTVNAIKIDPKKVIRNPYQPRKTFDDFYIENLGNSMVLCGQLEPAKVMALPDGKYMLVSGENRWRAALLKGIELVVTQYVPDKSKDATGQKKDLMFSQLAGNTGLPVSEVEIAEFIQKCIDETNATIKEISEASNITENKIRSLLTISKSSDDVKELANKKEISTTAAAKLSKASKEKREQIINKAKSEKKKVKVADVEKEVSGRASIITAASVEKLISYSVKMFKNSDDYIKYYSKADMWDKITSALKCVLGKDQIENIMNQ